MKLNEAFKYVKEAYYGAKEFERFAFELKKTIKYFMFYENGNSIDLKDFSKATKQLAQIMKKDRDLDDKGMQKLYPDATIEYMKIDDPNLKEVASDNTYNWGYLAPDMNLRIYDDEENGRAFLLINVHLGGDIRGGYGENNWFEATDADRAHEILSGIVHGTVGVQLIFKDGSKVSLDSEQDSDVPYYQINNADKKGLALEFENVFEKADRSDRDEAVDSLVDMVK